MPGYIKEVLQLDQIVRFKTLNHFLSYFGTEPRRLSEPRKIYLLISVKYGEGFCYVDNEYVPLTTGSLVLVNPYSFLHMANTQYLLGNVVIFTDAFFCVQDFSEILLHKAIYDPRVKPVVQLAAKPEKLEYVIVMMKMFGTEYRLDKDKSGHNEILLNALSALILLLHSSQLQTIGDDYDSHHQEEAKLVINFIKLLNVHYKEEKSVEFYANEMYIPVAKFTRDCKRGCGWNPKAIISAKILIESKRLLIFDHRSIAEISYDLGFPEISGFNSFIRQHLKLSPSEFRKQNGFGSVKENIPKSSQV